jgi:CRISPR/Cas system-associated protein endoribonuclease Cas2
MRIVQNRKAAEKHYRRIKEYAPKTGASFNQMQKRHNLSVVPSKMSEKNVFIGSLRCL